MHHAKHFTYCFLVGDKGIYSLYNPYIIYSFFPSSWFKPWELRFKAQFLPPSSEKVGGEQQSRSILKFQSHSPRWGDTVTAVVREGYVVMSKTSTCIQDRRHTGPWTDHSQRKFSHDLRYTPLLKHWAVYLEMLFTCTLARITDFITLAAAAHSLILEL